MARDKKSTKKSKASKSSLPKIEEAGFMATEKKSELPLWTPQEKSSVAADKSSMASTESANMAEQLPGESADGRMGADISLLIEDITDYRDLLNRHTAEDKANLQALDKEVDVLEYRIMKIESRMQKRETAKKEYTKTLVDTEKAFNAIVNTANSVANILKPPTEAELKAMDVPDTVKAGSKATYGKGGIGTD
jgi:DNA repair exonuclease SbcCD ATPase subunit